jgi:NAD(P)-dependent dehydrogenase (short-subunit alcohol dehydrogenase family)
MAVVVRGYKPALDLLAGRTILITGAGDGIGRAISIGFARHGACVVLLGRHVAKLESVYDEIVRAGAPEPAIYPLDLAGAMPGDHVEVAARIEAQLGSLDGLVHNAALLGDLTPLEEYDPLVWANVMQVNLHAPFLLTRACLPLMKRADRASIVFTSSEVGRRPRAYWGAYAVSQCAIEGLARLLADELGSVSAIRVNAINPGAVRTRMRAQAYPAEDPATLPDPADLLGPYLYLMGPDGAGLNGASVDAQP